MKKIINISNAEIKTATVEVKTLTISGKQVTLAVFRQLMDVNLIDPWTGKLNGVPWGIVNYHPGVNCHGLGAHFHVVWQQGNNLYRSCITESFSNTNFELEGQEEKRHRLLKDFLQKIKLSWIFASLVDSIQKGASPYWELIRVDGSYSTKTVILHLYDRVTFNWYYQEPGFIKKPMDEWDCCRLPTDIFGNTFALFYGEEVKKLPDISLDKAKKVALDYWNDLIDYSNDIDFDLDKDVYLDAESISKYFDPIKEIISKHTEQCKSRRIEWGKRYEELSALDQLFIAV